MLKFIKRALGLKDTGPTPYNDWLRAETGAAAQAETAESLNTYLMHRNGYVREAALVRVRGLLLGATLPAVVIRLNDWVPQVRAVAQAAFRAFIEADRFDDIVAALPDIYALKKRGRADHAATVEEVEYWVSAHAKRVKLVRLIAKAPPALARCCFDIAWKYKLQDNVPLLRLGLRSRDIVTAKRACQSVAALPEQPRREFIDILLRAKNGWFRLAGLRLLGDAEASAQARHCLLDNYSRLREWCEKRLALPPEELWKLRRAAISTDAPSAQALVAIRLCGGAKDAAAKPLIIPFLKHAKPDCRGAALLALARISPAEYEFAVKAALTDPAAAVGRAAVQAARDAGYALSPQEWEDTLRRAATAPVCRRLLSLARSRGKWDHLGLALALVAQAKFPDMAAPELAAWRLLFNRSAVTASPQQRAWIAKNLASYQGSAPSRTEIEFYLK